MSVLTRRGRFANRPYFTHSPRNHAAERLKEEAGERSKEQCSVTESLGMAIKSDSHFAS